MIIIPLIKRAINAKTIIRCLVPRRQHSEINNWNDVRKHICKAIFSDFSDFFRDRRADTLFHLTRQSASNDYQSPISPSQLVKEPLLRIGRSSGHLYLCFDLSIMAANHICQQADIDVTLRVVSAQQSSPVFNSLSPVCLVRKFLLWRLLYHQQMGSPR